MKRIAIEEIVVLNQSEYADRLHYLFFDEDGSIITSLIEPSITKVKFVIERGGFESTMDGNFYTTHLKFIGFTGESYKQSKVEDILMHLKKSKYAPQNDNWR